jgi:hypothetical protein
LSKYSIHGLFKKLRKVRVTKHTHSEIEKWTAEEVPAKIKELSTKLDFCMVAN